jgi:hypothetical protein
MKIIKIILELYSWKNYKESFKTDPIGTLIIGMILYFLPIMILWGLFWNNILLPYIKNG